MPEMQRSSKSQYRDQDIRIVGVTFGDCQKVLWSCSKNQPVTLVRELNPFDRKAIRVETLDGRKLGYIPARTSTFLVDFGFEKEARIKYLSGRDIRGATITIRTGAPYD